MQRESDCWRQSTPGLPVLCHFALLCKTAHPNLRLQVHFSTLPGLACVQNHNFTASLHCSPVGPWLATACPARFRLNGARMAPSHS